MLIYCLLKGIRVNIPHLIIDFMLSDHLLIPTRNLPYGMILTHLFKHFKINQPDERVVNPSVDINSTLLKRMYDFSLFFDVGQKRGEVGCRVILDNGLLFWYCIDTILFFGIVYFVSECCYYFHLSWYVFLRLYTFVTPRSQNTYLVMYSDSHHIFWFTFCIFFVLYLIMRLFCIGSEFVDS